MGSPNQGPNGNSPSQTPIGGVTGALYGNINEDTAAPTIDQSGVNNYLTSGSGSLADDTSQQQQTLGEENLMAQGKGPSAATALLANQTATAQSGANSLASSNSGANGAGAARRTAMMTGANATQQMGGQAATARAQEQIGATGAAAGQEQNMAGNQLAGAGLEAGLATNQAQIQQQNQQLSQNAQLANQKANEGTGNQVLGAASGVVSAIGSFLDADFVEPAPPGSRDKNGAPPAHFTFREERGGPNHLPFMALIDRTTGRARKIATEELTPSEHHQLYAPHAAGPLDSPQRKTAEMHDMNMGGGMRPGQQQQPSLANANMSGQTGNPMSPVGGGGWMGPTGPNGGGGKMYGDGEMGDDPRFAEMVRRAHPSLYHAATGGSRAYADGDAGPQLPTVNVEDLPKAKPAQQPQRSASPRAPVGTDARTPTRYSTPDDDAEAIRHAYENGPTLGGRHAGSAADYANPNYGESDLNNEMYRSTVSGYGPDTSMGHRGPDPEDQPGSDADWDRADDLAMASPTNPKSKQEYDARAKAATARWTDRQDSPEEAAAKERLPTPSTGRKIMDAVSQIFGGARRGPTQQYQQQRQPSQQRRQQPTAMPQGPWTPPPAAPAVAAPAVAAPQSPSMQPVPSYNQYGDGEAGGDAAASGGGGGMLDMDSLKSTQADTPVTFPASVSAPLQSYKDGDMGGDDEEVAANKQVSKVLGGFADGEMDESELGGAPPKRRREAPPEEGGDFDPEVRGDMAERDPSIVRNDVGGSNGDWMPTIFDDAEGKRTVGQSNGKDFRSPLAKTMATKKPARDVVTDDAGRYPEEREAIDRLRDEGSGMTGKGSERRPMTAEEKDQHDVDVDTLLRQAPQHLTHEGNRAKRKQNHPDVYMDLDAKERTGAGSKEDPMEADSWEPGTEDNPVDLDEDTPENQQGAREMRDSFTGRVPKAHTEYAPEHDPALDWGKGPDPAHDAFLRKQAKMFEAMNPYVEVKPKPALAALFPAKKGPKVGPTDWLTALHESNQRYNRRPLGASLDEEATYNTENARHEAARNAKLGAADESGLVPGEAETIDIGEAKSRVKNRKAVHNLLEQWKAERSTRHTSVPEKRYADGEMTAPAAQKRSALASTMKRKTMVA